MACNALLPQLRRRIDQKPVDVINADSDRGLAAGCDRPAFTSADTHGAATIPLGNAASRCSSENDHAKHGTNAGQRMDQSTLKKAEGPLPTGRACQSKRPTSTFSELARGRRLLPHRRCVHVDFQTHRHFEDFWCFPGHYEISTGFNEDTARLPCL